MHRVDRARRDRGSSSTDSATAARQRPDAVPRARAHPVAGRQHRAPELLLELRAARLVPRDRARLPDQPQDAGRCCRGPARCWPSSSSRRSIFPVSIQRQGSDVIYFTAMKVSGPPAWIALPVVFVLVAATLAGPAETVGRCFGELPPLTAYRYDLLGSLIGIGSFTLLSLFWAPSVVWGAIAGLALLVLNRGAWRRLLAVAQCGLSSPAMLLSETLTAGVSWSPYYKVTTHPSRSGPGALSIWVNGVPHQTMARADWRLAHAAEQYGTPYERLPGVKLDNVLVVGAGSGIRRRHRPAQGRQARGRRRDRPADPPARSPAQPRPRLPGPPGDDPRERRPGLPGEHRHQVRPDPLRLPGLARSRQRCLADPARVVPVHRGGAALGPRPPQARRRLRDVQLLPRELADRPPRRHRRGCLRAHALRGQLHRPPGGGHGGRPGEQPEMRAAPTGPARRRWWRLRPTTPRSSTTAAASRRSTSGRCSASCCCRCCWCARSVGRSARMRPYADLFFMGVAFLLLETKNVATFALLFGTTWLVNALVFAGVLLVVLAAVETTRRFRTPPLPVVFAGVPGLARAGLGGQAGVPARAPLRCHACCSRRSSPSCRSSWPTSRSPSASRRPPTPRRPSR